MSRTRHHRCQKANKRGLEFLNKRDVRCLGTPYGKRLTHSIERQRGKKSVRDGWGGY